MKNLKNILLVAILTVLSALPVCAQDFDLFSAPRLLVLQPPIVLTAANATVTNTLDTHGYVGIADLQLMTVTNSNAGALTATLYTSPDRTNLTALANFAIGVSNVVTITNATYGTLTLIATNTSLLPGYTNTPTAATAGFSTSYLVPVGFTNTGAITVTASGYYNIGLNIGDANRYLHIVWTPTGASSNDTVGATLLARKSQ